MRDRRSQSGLVYGLLVGLCPSLARTRFAICNSRICELGKLRGGKDEESEREGDIEVTRGGISGDGGEDERSRRRIEVVRARRDSMNGRREGEIGWLTIEGGKLAS